MLKGFNYLSVLFIWIIYMPKFLFCRFVYINSWAGNHFQRLDSLLQKEKGNKT
jgi:hypothetical protein